LSISGKTDYYSKQLKCHDSLNVPALNISTCMLIQAAKQFDVETTGANVDWLFLLV